MQRTNSQGGTIRNQLRVHTQAVHELLHEHSLFASLFDRSIDQIQYRDLLTKFHGFYVPLEQAIDHAIHQSEGKPIGLRYAKRAQYLEQDLFDLGLSAAEIEQNPHVPEMAEIVTPASLGGVLYVIEGSTLGATQIDRAAQKILRKDKFGRNFWAWSRANNKTCWAEINAYLEQLEGSDRSTDTLLKGAQDTFQALANWLAPLDDPVALNAKART